MENLDIFTVVVEQQSLNRASRILNLSQPALSRKIARLETELGVELFVRKGKRLALTSAGRVCYDYAVSQKKLENEFMQSLSIYRTGNVPAGLTIGASLTTLQWSLPELISLYTREYPQTDIKAITGKTHEIVTLIQEQKADIGLVASFVDQPGLHCVPLFDDHLCLVHGAGHPLNEQSQIKVADMDGLPMIWFSKGTWYRILTDELFHQTGIVPNVKMEIDSFEAILRLVSTLQVATLLPMSYIRRNVVSEGELVVRQIPELEQTKRTTSLIFTTDTSHNAALNAFIWKAKDHFMSFSTS